MAKNDFRVASIFKIVIRICMKNVEFCRKKFLTLPLPKKKRISKTPENFSLVKIVTDYHKLSLLPLLLRP